MAPAKKKAKKDWNGDKLNEVKEHTKQALAEMRSEFQMQLNQMKEFLVSNKADAEEKRKKQAEDEDLRKKEREELGKAPKIQMKLLLLMKLQAQVMELRMLKKTMLAIYLQQC